MKLKFINRVPRAENRTYNMERIGSSGNMVAEFGQVELLVTVAQE